MTRAYLLALLLAVPATADATAGPFRRLRDRRTQTAGVACPAPAPVAWPWVTPDAPAQPDWRPALLPGLGELGTPRGVFGPFTAGCPGGVCPAR